MMGDSGIIAFADAGDDAVERAVSAFDEGVSAGETPFANCSPSEACLSCRMGRLVQRVKPAWENVLPILLLLL